MIKPSITATRSVAVARRCGDGGKALSTMSSHQVFFDAGSSSWKNT